jgi:hypothetical protein
MPYIKLADRIAIQSGVLGPDTPGELNYLFTRLALEYVERKGLNYQRINDVVGALEGAKLEFYRRLAAPYEDKKIAENGDVYP